jgi:hypothetical protein
MAATGWSAGADRRRCRWGERRPCRGLGAPTIPDRGLCRYYADRVAVGGVATVRPAKPGSYTRAGTLQPCRETRRHSVYAVFGRRKAAEFISCMDKKRTKEATPLPRRYLAFARYRSPVLLGHSGGRLTGRPWPDSRRAASLRRPFGPNSPAGEFPECPAMLGAAKGERPFDTPRRLTQAFPTSESFGGSTTNARRCPPFALCWPSIAVISGKGPNASGGARHG